MKQKQTTVGKFYDKTGISFQIGAVRCHALKFSFEQQHRSFPSHSHSSNSWEIHYIAYGKGTITLDHTPYPIGPDSLFITGPHIEHSQTPDPEDPMAEYCIYLKFEAGNHPLIQAGNPEFLNRFFSASQFITRDRQNLLPLMQTLFYELETCGIGYRTALEALLTQLLVLTVRNLDHSKNTTSVTESPTIEPSPADRNYLIIEECFLYENQDLTLKTLASRLGLSQRQTERLLQKHYGKTFLQKKFEAKMSEALVLLKDPSNSITDISIQLGYSSVEHFSAAFRNYYGISPREHRKLL